MTKYIIHIEGQQIPVDAAIGADDSLVRRALSPVYPEVANAAITRVEKDDICTIQVVKKAGSKGLLDAVAALDACPGGMNPAAALLIEIRKSSEAMSIAELINLDQRIEQAILDGKKQADMLDHAINRLIKSVPQPAPAVPWGF